MHNTKIKTREDIIYTLPKGSVGAEIGVFEGSFSKYIINAVRPTSFYMVDLFEGSMVSGDKNGENMKQIDLGVIYTCLCNEFKDNGSVKIFKGKSSDFYNVLPDDTLDFIYIDGDHSYAGVKLDLESARRKVKAGGMICGHDYTPRFQGVMDAVNEFCHEYKLTKHITTDDGCPSFVIVNHK